MNKNEKLQFILTSLPNLEIHHVEENNHGWDNEIMIVNHQLVFRFPKNDEIAHKIRMEKQLLDLLITKELLLQIPNYTLLFNKYKKLICSYHPYIAGVQLNLNNLVNIDESAKLLGDFLTKLHSIQASDFKQGSISVIHTITYWHDFYSSIQKEIFPLLLQAYQQKIEQLFQHFFSRYRNDATRNCVIHGDLTKANILYNPTYQLVTGVIDFTDAQLSDPAFDFAGFYWDFGSEFTRKILSYYTGSESAHSIYERVRRFYGLQPIFHELLHAIRNGITVNANEKIQKLFILQEKDA